MTSQEIHEVVASTGVPMVKRTEKYEDSRRFVGTIFGETVASESPFALAFQRACGMGGDEAEAAAIQSPNCCGIACDSDCACL